MKEIRALWVTAIFAALILFAMRVTAQSAPAAQASPPSQSQTAPSQTPATPPEGAPAGRGRGRGSAFPTHTNLDSALVARGKQIFSVNCSFCHGSDARGGEGGPNLVRSQLVLDDKDGELISPVVQNGRPDRGMPKFSLSDDDLKAVVEFIHSIPTNGGNAVPASAILVGDAKAGEAFFNGPGKCATCHSVTGDLAGVGAKYDPRMLQNKLVFPLGGRGFGVTATGQSPPPPVTVTVTLPSGEHVEGKLEYLDDFTVSLTDSAGNHLSYARNGDLPKVEIKNPVEAHRQMMRTITDSEIHNLTAYLETLK